MTDVQKPTNKPPQVGERYIGWDKTWVVTKVWPQGVVDATNVDDPSNTIRRPTSQFVHLLEKDES